MQNRVGSFSFLKSKAAAASYTPSTTSKESTAPRPSSQESWKVDEAFLEQGSLLVPASPDDVDDTVRSAFIAKAFQDNQEWVDADFVQYSLGVALDIFPEKATFDSLKWIFVSLDLAYLM